ncbi:MAG TPA: HAMP domain-containing histidine kinase [Candidatus Cloacimonetes bacterium]|nr:HAMP domain-containing histidine kinase [Candidatus Cloacimonadota bacterium]HEX37842.1 HAMP domain-containing histidine kinase [Candidatus Cloacimonadota bacterium]
MKNNSKNLTFIKTYFIIGSILIILFFVIYTNSLLQQVRKELEVFPKIYARFAEVSTKENIESDLLEIILTEVIQKINYPIIVADAHNNPKYWKNIDPTIIINDERLQNLIENMEKNETNIVLKEPVTGEVISKIVYSSSKTIKRLKFLPYFEFGIVILFISVGIIGLAILKKREKESLWIALAKETAHQFGTPITSLLGWLEVLKTKTANCKEVELMDDIVQNMQTDIHHLQKIASRFGKVGSEIKIQKANIDVTIQATIDYFRERIPQSTKQVNLNYINKAEEQVICFDPELFKWALENLIKNAIDAMKDKSGNIFVITYDKGDKFYLQIKDEGCGIPKKAQKQIFKTGYTTKKRGWGLGLALAKRIIEEFHLGKIYIVRSEPGEGSTIEIMLKKKIVEVTRYVYSKS